MFCIEGSSECFLDYFRVIRNRLKTDFGMARDSFEFFGLNYNPKLWSGLSSIGHN